LSSRSELQPPTILRVMPLEGFRLRLELGSGSVLELDMSNRLDTIRFCPLRERRSFSRSPRTAEGVLRQGPGDHGGGGHESGDGSASPLCAGR
jgi:hypothetical protein